MNAWGLKIQELLDEHKMSSADLAREIKASRSTITNWLNNPEGVTPKPLMVAKVAKAFGAKTRDIAPFAGYPIQVSADDTERSTRRAALQESPRVSALLDGLDKLNARDQDTVISMLEVFVTSRSGHQ